MEEMDDAFWDQVMTLNPKSIFAMTHGHITVYDRWRRNRQYFFPGRP